MKAPDANAAVPQRGEAERRQSSKRSAQRGEAERSREGPPQGEAAQRAAGERSRKAWTILELLRWTTRHFAERGIETARLDAECLLAHALGVERLRLYLDFEKPVCAAERAAFRELVRRRAAERVPVAQLVGRREFWSMPLRVNGAVLVPRPETESLVEAALERLPAQRATRVLDLGTGSGAVALALARERPLAQLTATDVSEAALELARENADELRMGDRIRFLAGRLFEPVAGERFDLVVSNPPYVAESQRNELPPELGHEPPQALFAGPDGTEVLAALVRGVRAVLAPGGALALEVAPEQAPRVAGWCREQGLLDVTTRRDLAGRERVVLAGGGG
jgi:release factor glutamine methyltransferase